MYTVRSFEYTDADYQTFVAICNAYRPEEAVTVEQFKHEDEQRSDKFFYHRDFIAYQDDMVAWGAYYQTETTHKAKKVGFYFMAHPNTMMYKVQ